MGKVEREPDVLTADQLPPAPDEVDEGNLERGGAGPGSYVHPDNIEDAR